MAMLQAPLSKRERVTVLRCEYFVLACQSCGNEGELSIESRDTEEWDYWITGFMAPISQTGVEGAAAECCRCGSNDVQVAFDGAV